MKSTINTVTTTFVGGHYDVTNGVATKYYFAGAQRVAMRSGSTLSYLLSDHLGSTSLVVKDTITGVWANDVVSEMRYKPWGEVRYATTNTTLPTRYTYTGQYSYMDDPSTTSVTEGFGLMFYNARWYDPYLNHFTQPDTIVPEPYNSQDYDRYSYARNNPIRFTDPTGHCTVDDVSDENPQCGQTKDHEERLAKYNLIRAIKSKFKNVNIKDIDAWTYSDLQEIEIGLTKIMGKNGFNGDMDAFNAAFDEVTFVPYDLPAGVAGDATWQTGVIRLDPDGNWGTVIHEMGHLFSAALKRENEVVPSYRQMYSNVFDAGPGATKYGRTNSVEDFADSFLAVIKYGAQTNKISRERREVIIALMQSYTNSDHTLSPGR